MQHDVKNLSIPFRGFQWVEPYRQLKGSTITIPAGTYVHSTSVKNCGFSKKKRIVKIHHFLPGMSICVGHYFNNELRHYFNNRHDIELVKEIYGSDDESVWLPFVQRNKDSAFLPIHNPSVVWVGSRGYWSEVDINLVPELLEKIQNLQE